MDILQAYYIFFSIVVTGIIFGAYYKGKYDERREWNKLIKQGKIRKPTPSFNPRDYK